MRQIHTRRLDRSAEFRAFSSFHLDESDGSIPLDYQIYVAVSASEAALHHAPTPPEKPPLRNSLPELSERLPGR